VCLALVFQNPAADLFLARGDNLAHAKPPALRPSGL
jgi:hypothetical protein